jgi:hypothetical protein
MIVDSDSWNVVAGIAGQKHNHGVALAPEVGRGFIADGIGSKRRSEKENDEEF